MKLVLLSFTMFAGMIIFAGCKKAKAVQVRGCTNSTATNYNLNATEDDGSCKYAVKGCKDSTATNYNPNATVDDGSCTYNKPDTSKPSGIANSYPNDVGIENDPNVLYVEKFDDGMTRILSRYTDIKNSAGMSLDTDVPAGSLGPNSIRMTNIGGQNDGGHLFKNFSPGFDSTVYIRYYVKYPLISQGYTHHESVWFGGYNPSLSYTHPRAGICGLGDSRLTVAYEPYTSRPTMDTYLYWGDMKSWNGGTSCYGNDMVNGSPTAQNTMWDQWTCIEVMIKLNNPVTAYNGELRVWQNGVEVGYWGPGFPNGQWKTDSWFNNPADPPFPGFRWRTNANLKINYIWIEYYDDTSPPNIIHHIKYDHFVMAKKYIGPIKK